MRVIERQGSREDEHFSEGEPDLEAPEELAVLEVDDETVLEEDLDTSADREDEVDIEVLENSLEILVHGGDAEDDDIDVLAGADATPGRDGEPLNDDLEIEELEDREESLDRILQAKLAGDEDREDDRHELEIDAVASAGEVRVSCCGSDEFVCAGCFLVCNLSQRARGSATLCHDCGE